MKKKVLASVACLCMILGLAGCNSNPTTIVPDETDAPAVTTEAPATTTEAPETPAPTPIAKAEGSAVQADASEWIAAVEQEFKFPSYQFGFYDEKNALSVGYNGEIHYINAEETEWPKAQNESLCRFGMEIIGGNICYTCGNGGHVTKSTDGGKTFTRVADFGSSEPNQCSMMSFCDENNGVIASAKNLAITSDGAASWNELKAPAEIAAIRMVSPEKFYFVGSDFNFYVTEDGGATWAGTPMDLPLADGYLNKPRSFALRVDGENMFTIFCIESESKTLRSYSTADNWLSCTENVIPEYTELKKAALYFNNDGSLMTLTNMYSKKVVALKVK